MLRALKFIIITVIVLGIAWGIGSLPGTVTAQAGRYTVATSVPAAVVMLAAVAVLLAVLLRVIGGLRAAPGGFGAWRGGRRQKLGEIATQRGIVALAAGDAAGASAEASRARKLLGEAPLVLMLEAESARLAGRAEQAKAAFARLTQHKEMAFLGHRGLLRHHADVGDHETAQSHARAAEAAYPGSSWAREQRRDIAVRQGDYAAALALSTAPVEVAALATAAAGQAAEPKRALAYAKQAVKANPRLAPAVVALAQALRAAGKPRAAKKTLLEGWAASPNPLIAAAFLAPLSTPIERAQAATELAARKPGHVESELLLAETDLAARLPAEARRHAQGALAAGAADGRAEGVLAVLDSAAPVAARKPVWRCGACKGMSQDWSPVCPTCQRIGTLAWQPGTALA